MRIVWYYDWSFLQVSNQYVDRRIALLQVGSIKRQLAVYVSMQTITNKTRNVRGQTRWDIKRENNRTDVSPIDD